ncbi:tRNA(fMet)-specific endonuclease VapC [Candidatus Calditenuaceae archaeon HR02]|nr:tRNA(fMet)-specific endonuclease VapC [Candidatus Calditenuaceae archaeon HR02]
MIYVDTSLIISYVDEKDPQHNVAEKLVQDIRGEKLVVSSLVLTELASVYSRAGLEKPLQLAMYSVELIGAELVEIDFNETLKQSFRLAPTLRLKTLDLLHVATCHLIKAEKLATLDREIASISETLSKLLGMKVLIA